MTKTCAEVGGIVGTVEMSATVLAINCFGITNVGQKYGQGNCVGWIRDGATFNGIGG